MSHQQARNDADTSSLTSAEKTPERVSETLPIMAPTTKQSLEIKGQDPSYDSGDTAQTSSVKKQVITPPPAGGSSASSSSKASRGPILSSYGDTHLYSSPIRVKKRTRTASGKKESAGEGSSVGQQREEQEKMSPVNQSPSSENINKEEKDQADDLKPSKKARIFSSPEHTMPQDQRSVQAWKPIVSPTSSYENKADDESTNQFSYGSLQPYYGRQAFQHRYPHHPNPHHHPYGWHSYYQNPPAYNIWGEIGPTPHVSPPPHRNTYYRQHDHPHYPPRHSMMSPMQLAQCQFPMTQTVSIRASDAGQASIKSLPAPPPSSSEYKHPDGHHCAPPPHRNTYYRQHDHPHYTPRHSMMPPMQLAQFPFPMRRTVNIRARDASQASTKSLQAPPPSSSKIQASRWPPLRSTASSKHVLSSAPPSPLHSTSSHEAFHTIGPMSISNEMDGEYTGNRCSSSRIQPRRPPSAERCIPLNGPGVPSKCGPSDTNKDIKIPSFTALSTIPTTWPKPAEVSLQRVRPKAKSTASCVVNQDTLMHSAWPASAAGPSPEAKGTHYSKTEQGTLYCLRRYHLEVHG